MSVKLSYRVERTQQADNENRRLFAVDRDPAAFYAWLCRLRQRLLDELEADFRLRFDLKHRSIWNEVNAMEQCFLWHYGEGWKRRF